MRMVCEQQGICFVIISFSETSEIFYLTAEKLFMFWERMINGGRKSITKHELEINGHSISLGYHPRIDYIKVIDTIYKFN